MKIYIIEHAFNEAWKPYSFHEIIAAYTTREKAMEELDKIADTIERGESTYFPGFKLQRERDIEGKRITFPWYSEGEQMYTHFYISEKELF